MGAGTRARRALLRLRLAAQPYAARLPRPVQGLLRRAARRTETPAVGLADWSRGLVGDAPVEFPPPSAVASESPAHGGPVAHTTRRELSCVILAAHLDVGGMDGVILSHVRGLPAHGFRVAVLQAQEPDEAPRPYGRTGAELVELGVEVADFRTGDLAGWLADRRPDVVSVHGGATWGIEMAHRLGVPAVETLHGMHFLFAADQAEVRRRDAMLDAVVSVSELVREQYLDKLPDTDGRRVVTIPNGVDLRSARAIDRVAARAALGLTDEFLFTSLARHCVQKNTYGLVAVFEEVARRHADAHLLIAGRPDSPAYLAQTMALRDRMVGGERVHLRDHAPRPELLLAASDAFVLDSFFEGWALASMEALVMGVPAVCADVGGAREQLAGSVPSGFLVGNPLGDPVRVDWETIRRMQYQRQPNHDEVVAAMSALVRDRAEWRARADDIADEATRRFDLGVAVARHAEVLRAVAEHAPLPTPV